MYFVYCAYCGKEHDAPTTSNTKKKWEFSSECSFAGNTLNVKKLQTIEVSFPLANFPMKCPHCEKSVWRFDMRKHVEKEHPEKEFPAEAIISKAEKGILQKKKARLANALSVKDLEKLDENELKLLPAKDFWDSKKKQWKKNVYGTFAKRNSVKMKIFLSINDS